MALELLFPHFDELIRTPEDVQRLNEAILQLAVQGKLVAQDPNDEPASELLKRIEAERLPLASGSRAPNPVQPIDPDTMPNAIPPSWVWVRMNDVGVINPRNYVDADTAVSFIPMALINDGIGSGHSAHEILWRDVRNGFTHFAENDVGIAKITPCFQNRKSTVFRGLTNGVGAGTTELHVWRSIGGNVVPEYALLFFQSPAFIENGKASMTGTAGQQRVPRNYVEQALFPLPPLAEQHRIVAKVDALFAQTRALEASLRQAQADIVIANRATLHRLHTAQDDDQFQAAWRTLREHFDVLYDDPRNVAELRQAILDLAVRGKLVPQDPEDEPVQELLKRIEGEREQLVKNRLISAEDASPMQIDLALQVPIAILGEVRSGIQKSNIRDPRDNPRRYITVAHVQRNRIDLGDPRYFEVSDEELEKWRLLSGDVLVIEGNGSAEHIGRAALFLGEIEDCVHQNHVIRVRPNRDFILPEYLNLFLNSPPGREKILERSRTTSGLYNLSVGRIRTIEVPLPALSRQQRIVAKVDQLMRLCDALEAGLLHAQAGRQRLVEAVLHGVTAG